MASTLHTLAPTAVLDFYGTWPAGGGGPPGVGAAVDPAARQAPGLETMRVAQQQQQQQDVWRQQFHQQEGTGAAGGGSFLTAANTQAYVAPLASSSQQPHAQSQLNLTFASNLPSGKGGAALQGGIPALPTILESPPALPHGRFSVDDRVGPEYQPRSDQTGGEEAWMRTANRLLDGMEAFSTLRDDSGALQRPQDSPSGPAEDAVAPDPGGVIPAPAISVEANSPDGTSGVPQAPDGQQLSQESESTPLSSLPAVLEPSESQPDRPLIDGASNIASQPKTAGDEGISSDLSATTAGDGVGPPGGTSLLPRTMVLPAPSSGPSPNLVVAEMLHGSRTELAAESLMQSLFAPPSTKTNAGPSVVGTVEPVTDPKPTSEVHSAVIPLGQTQPSAAAAPPEAPTLIAADPAPTSADRATQPGEVHWTDKLFPSPSAAATGSSADPPPVTGGESGHPPISLDAPASASGDIPAAAAAVGGGNVAPAPSLGSAGGAAIPGDLLQQLSRSQLPIQIFCTNLVLNSATGAVQIVEDLASVPPATSALPSTSLSVAPNVPHVAPHPLPLCEEAASSTSAGAIAPLTNSHPPAVAAASTSEKGSGGDADGPTPSDHESMAAELTRLILKAFDDNGGVITPHEPISTAPMTAPSGPPGHRRSDRPPPHATGLMGAMPMPGRLASEMPQLPSQQGAAWREKQWGPSAPSIAAPAASSGGGGLFLADLNGPAVRPEAASGAAAIYARARTQPSDMPSVLPNPSVPRGKGSAFLQVHVGRSVGHQAG